MIWLAVPAALTVGYLAGHWRIPSRVLDRLVDLARSGSRPGTVRRFGLEALAALMLAAVFVLRPRRTVRLIRAAHAPGKRSPAPRLSPRWDRR